MSETIYQVTLPHLCAGVVVRQADQRIVRAAPILAWSQGKPLAVLVAWVRRKGGRVRTVTAD